MLFHLMLNIMKVELGIKTGPPSVIVKWLDGIYHVSGAWYCSEAQL